MISSMQTEKKSEWPPSSVWEGDDADRAIKKDDRHERLGKVGKSATVS